MRYILTLIMIPLLILAQKKDFELKDAMDFHHIGFKQLSQDGKWLAYQTKPDRGNPILYIKSTETETEFQFPRGGSPSWSEKMNTVSFLVRPDVVAIANDKDKKLTDTLYILNTETSKIVKIPDAKSGSVSNDGNWIKYGKSNFEKNQLFLRNVTSGTDIILENVEQSKFDSTSSYIFYIKDSEDKANNGVFYRDLTKNFAPEIKIELDTNAVFDQISWNTKKNILAYKKSTLDSNDKKTNFEIKLWNLNTNGIFNAAYSEEFEGWYIPEKNNMYWTEDGERLWFGLKPDFEKIEDKDDKDKKIDSSTFYSFDSLLNDTEMYMWHHDDDRIITEKQTKWNQIKDRTYDAVFHLNSKKSVRLGDTNLVNVERTDNNLYALAYDYKPYEKRITWDYWYYDLYIVDLFSGERTLIDKELMEGGHLSPLSQNVAYFKDDHWYSYDILSKTKMNITEVLEDAKFYNEENDRPRKNFSYGFGAWYRYENTFLIYDKYDIWEVNAENGSMNCLTQASGRIDNLRFRLKMLGEEYYIEEKARFIEMFNYKSQEQNLLILNTKIKKYELFENDYAQFLGKSKNNEKVLFSKERYDLYPDLWVSDTSFTNPKQLTNLHPEIKEYNWGTTKMVEYVNSTNDTLLGYYITPDNFDNSKKYPLFVYFYERFSQRRHQFSVPKINHRPIYPYYVGKGYCMFFPDIKFRQGRPGDSGLDAVMSGIRKLSEKGFIDTNKIALHGHSWSGYQSAYFVTQTDFFAACVTGAPVSNMTSAYSGIRLGSGLARQFQYEKTQSRIGGTLIDSLDAYIENSPVFYADKMNTPMLIMFGDRDDAVPWQQGVELFLSCRRYGKPAIFLQYEDEPHHLKKYPNKLDYAIKMSQFFDHYVLGKEPEKWIIEGVEYQGTYNTGNARKADDIKSKE